MNLILIERHEVDDAGRVRLADRRAGHIVNVLQPPCGAAIRVGLLDGPLGRGRVETVGGGEVVLHCEFESDTPERPPLDLLLALPRPKVMRRLWAPLAGMGVGRIMLTNAWKVERNYFDTHVLAPGTYRPLLIEGLEQAGDTRLPEVSIHRQFKVLVEDQLDPFCPAGLRLVADPSGSVSILEAAANHEHARASNARVLLAVGPEGGWTDYELRLLETHGFHRVSLGPRLLRTDVACIALLALARAAMGVSGQSAAPG